MRLTLLIFLAPGHCHGGWSVRDHVDAGSGRGLHLALLGGQFRYPHPQVAERDGQAVPDDEAVHDRRVGIDSCGHGIGGVRELSLQLLLPLHGVAQGQHECQQEGGESEGELLDYLQLRY